MVTRTSQKPAALADYVVQSGESTFRVSNESSILSLSYKRFGESTVGNVDNITNYIYGRSLIANRTILSFDSYESQLVITLEQTFPNSLVYINILAGRGIIEFWVESIDTRGIFFLLFFVGPRQTEVTSRGML